MNARDDEFMRELMAAFTAEAAEHLAALSHGLIELEKSPPADRSREIIERIYREAHSLKGAARAVSMPSIEMLCQALESVLSAWKRGAGTVSAEQFDALHRAVDAVESLVSGAKLDAAAVAELVRPLASLAAVCPPDAASPPAGEPVRPPPPAAPPAPARATEPAETVRVSTAKLDALLFQVEELLSVKQAASQRVSDLREILELFGPWQRRWSKLRVDLRGAGGRPDRGGEPEALDLLDWGMGQARDIHARLNLLAVRLNEDERTGGRMVDSLLETARRALMLPASTILGGFPRMVRDLCRSQGKEAELLVQGDDIAIDKRILEEMKDPLTHLLRNSVDHGIEAPSERARARKPACGRIVVTFSQTDSRNVQLQIRDDGAGIDVERVTASAIREGILSGEDAERLARPEALMLIFRSAVSTTATVSEVSGRGLGLAIVREKVDRVGGRVAVESTPGEGSVFTIVIPLTLATFRGILAEVAGRVFVVPTAAVERVSRIRASDVRSIEGRPAVEAGGQTVALARLADVLELTVADNDARESFPAIIVCDGAQRLAFRVDRVLGEQEVLVKPLGRHLARVRNVSGATVLGTGELVVVLNVSDLVRSAASGAAGRPAAGAPAPESRPASRAARSILIAEDSFTSRMLLKNVLESAGYAVTTSVDGLAAWSLLRTEVFDALVSDVEMPGMDGFELTARIRADHALSELPVVLVTARETRADRERGVDAGANAYLAKSSFDQGQLLGVLERLI